MSLLEVVDEIRISLERDGCPGEGTEGQRILDVKIPLPTLNSLFKAHFVASMWAILPIGYASNTFVLCKCPPFSYIFLNKQIIDVNLRNLKQWYLLSMTFL